MYVKKWLALTLAGAVLAMGFSGCDRTIIEHQFHTNTITETIIEKVPVETEDVAGVQSIIDLFEENGIMFDRILGFTMAPVDEDETIDIYLDLYNAHGQEDIKNFYTDPVEHRISFAEKIVFRVSDDIPDWGTPDLLYLESAQNLVDQMYDALTTYMDENDWDWDAFKTNLGEKYDDLELRGYIYFSEEDFVNADKEPLEAAIILMLDTGMR